MCNRIIIVTLKNLQYHRLVDSSDKNKSEKDGSVGWNSLKRNYNGKEKGGNDDER